MRESGFTLIELLIASALIAIVMMFTMQTFTVNNRTYVKIDSVVDTQQSARAIASVLERDLRHAGMMIPEEAAICGIDSSNGPDRVFISDYTAINPAGALGSFDGSRVGGGVTTVAAGDATLVLDSLMIEPGTPDPAYDTDGNGVKDSDFRIGGGVIIADVANPNRGSVCGVVEDVDLASDSIDVKIVTQGMAAAGTATLIAVPALEYRIDGDTLLRNSLRLAEGVEDLQIAYFLDEDGDNVVDNGELFGDENQDYLAKDADASELRAVRFNVVVRTRTEDDHFTQGFFQATENRDPGAAADGFRRRVHTTVVRMRNIGDRVEGI